jgi:hypothetical protein
MLLFLLLGIILLGLHNMDKLRESCVPKKNALKETLEKILFLSKGEWY